MLNSQIYTFKKIKSLKNFIFNRYNDNTMCYEINIKDDEYTLTRVKDIHIKSKIHVSFDDDKFAKSIYCEYFKDIISDNIKQYRIITPNYSYNEFMNNDYKYNKFYLVKNKVLEYFVKKNKQEINICSCIIESSKHGHGGTIILGTDEQLINIIKYRKLNCCLNLSDFSLYDVNNTESDVCETLLSIPILDLIGKDFYIDSENNKISINNVLKQVIKIIIKNNEYKSTNILVGLNFDSIKDKNGIFIDVSHGKRTLFETSKQCAVRELNEEFLLNINIDDFKSSIYTCSTEFYIYNLNKNIDKDENNKENNNEIENNLIDKLNNLNI